MAYLKGKVVQWTDPVSGRRRSKSFSSEQRAKWWAEEKHEETRLLRDRRLTPQQVQENEAQRTPLVKVVAEYRKKLGEKSREKHIGEVRSGEV